MDLIKEPKGVDLIVGPSVLTEEDKMMISAAITKFKLTGKTPKPPKVRKAKESNPRRSLA